MAIETSVIIATYKRPALLSRCLRALINQSVDHNLYEIIIVSDGPDKQTAESINKVKHERSSRPAIHCFALDTKKGPAAARNLGWQRAKGKLVLFTDDDCIPSFYWVQFFRDNYIQSGKEEVAFAGKVKVPLRE